MLEQKLNDKSDLRCFKARLIPKRFFQKKFVDHSKTFATIVPFEILLLFLGKFVLEGRHVQRADILTAFQNEDIDAELYVGWANVVSYLKKFQWVKAIPTSLVWKTKVDAWIIWIQPTRILQMRVQDESRKVGSRHFGLCRWPDNSRLLWKWRERGWEQLEISVQANGPRVGKLLPWRGIRANGERVECRPRYILWTSTQTFRNGEKS